MCLEITLSDGQCHAYDSFDEIHVSHRLGSISVVCDHDLPEHYRSIHDYSFSDVSFLNLFTEDF